VNEEAGPPRPGDELWKSSLPIIVFFSRAEGHASLEITMANGEHLSAPISLQTAEGLVKDLGMKRIGGKG
jgi:hypothetical protein